MGFIDDFFENIIPREIRDPFASSRHAAQAAAAKARELERRAREESTRRLQEERRARRRRKGRQSTILASEPLGVTAPIGPSAGGRSTLG